MRIAAFRNNLVFRAGPAKKDTSHAKAMGGRAMQQLGERRLPLHRYGTPVPLRGVAWVGGVRGHFAKRPVEQGLCYHIYHVRLFGARMQNRESRKGGPSRALAIIIGTFIHVNKRTLYPCVCHAPAKEAGLIRPERRRWGAVAFQYAFDGRDAGGPTLRQVQPLQEITQAVAVAAGPAAGFAKYCPSFFRQSKGASACLFSLQGTPLFPFCKKITSFPFPARQPLPALSSYASCSSTASYSHLTVIRLYNSIVTWQEYGGGFRWFICISLPADAGGSNIWGLCTREEGTEEGCWELVDGFIGKIRCWQGAGRTTLPWVPILKSSESDACLAPRTFRGQGHQRQHEPAD